MPKMDVVAILERAKQAHGFKTDQELADQLLLVPRETLLSWKKRGSIPAKHLPALAVNNISLDWLLTGKGNQRTTNDYGGDKEGDLDLDDECLWICLILMVRYIKENNKETARISLNNMDIKHLIDFHIFLAREYPNIARSKKKWIESGIIKKKDVYKALQVEYDLGAFDMFFPPWWEDEEYV